MLAIWLHSCGAARLLSGAAAALCQLGLQGGYDVSETGGERGLPIGEQPTDIRPVGFGADWVRHAVAPVAAETWMTGRAAGAPSIN
jgi:hypothetical protein